MAGLRKLAAAPPVLLQISAMGINGLRMGVDPMKHFGNPPRAYDREELHLPSSIISEYDKDGNYDTVIADQMHFLWHAFGLERCSYFDEQNRWKGQ
jgi:hypothetical protein